MQTTSSRIKVESPYHDNRGLYNNADTNPDLFFMAPGMEKPLKLHREIMSAASTFMREMGTPSSNNNEKKREGWEYDTSRKIDRDALEKVVQFCYGETLEIEIEECCAVIASLDRLELTCTKDVVKTIIFHVLTEAKKDLNIGAKLLIESTLYPECQIWDGCGLDRSLAQIVLTAENIQNDYETVVTNCLMKLPFMFLDMAKYGDPHTKYSEFSIRMEYVKGHLDSLSIEQGELVLKNCDWDGLSYQELKELRELDIVQDKDLLDAFQNALEKTEKEVLKLKKEIQKHLERQGDCGKFL